MRFPFSSCDTGRPAFYRWVWLGVALSLLTARTGCAVEPPPPLVGEPSFHVHPWTVDDGTPADSVMGAVRRADGYLWVVTRTGLFRFDGTRFQSVQAVSAAALPRVVTPVLCEDRRGRMWLSKDSGVVACVDGADIRIFTLRDGLLDLKPMSMAEDGAGVIWVSYDNTQQVCRINDGQVQAVDAAAGLPGEGLIQLAGDSRGQVWFARGRQVGVLRAGRMVPLLTQEQPVTCIAAARPGGIWFSDGRQIWKFREDGPLEPLGPVPSGDVNLLHEDQRGRLWVATVAEDQPTASLFCRKDGDFRVVPVLCPFITSLSDDREGNLWVGTRRNGLIQVRQRTVELLNPLNPLSAGIRSFCEDTNGRRFAVGVDESLACSEGSGWELMTADRGWHGGKATCVAADPRGGVWLGTHQGLFQWRDGRFVNDDTRFAANIYVRSLLAGSNGDVWISEGSPRLQRLRDGSLHEFMLPGQTGTVCALAEDAGGGVWMATDDGRLLCVDGDNLADATPPTDFPDPIRSLHATPDGSLWIGYETCGLGRLKQGRTFQFGPEQGLDGGAIFQILSDERGWLWCAGDRGIFRMKLAELEAVAAGELPKVHLVSCGHDEGWPLLKANWDNWPGAARSRSGELCFSMNTGLAVIRPESSLEDPPTPVVLIDRLSVNGQPFAAYDSQLVPVRGHAVPPVELRGLTDWLSVGQGVRQLGVEFKVVSFRGQENIRFRYRLEGLDGTWVEAGSQRAAYYSLIPPGRYRFRVSACDNSGIWNEAGAALALIVVPFFWQTTWFKGICLAVGTVSLVGLGWWGARRRARRRLDELERAQAIERERTRIARDMHDEFGSRLTTIANLGEMAMNRSPAPTELMSHLGPIVSRVRELINTMDEVVWTVSPENDSLPSLAAFLSDYAERFVAASGTSFRLELDTDFPTLSVASEARHNLLLATKESLNNAVRHATPTVIHLKLHVRSGWLGVVVTDDGRGFEVGQTRAGGHGLANLAERMKLINGQAEIRSRPGQGTVVTLSMPLSGRPAGNKSTLPFGI